MAQFRRPKDVYAGLFFVVLGAAALVMSFSYQIGGLRRIGPGFFPALIGVILIGLGTGSLVTGLRRREPDPIMALRVEPLVLILIGALSFSFLIQRAGLIVAIFSLIFFSCFRRIMTNPVEVLLTFIVLAGFSMAVFIYGLGLSIPVIWQ